MDSVKFLLIVEVDDNEIMFGEPDVDGIAGNVHAMLKEDGFNDPVVYPGRFDGDNIVTLALAESVLDRDRVTFDQITKYLANTEEDFFDYVVGPAIDKLEDRVRLYTERASTNG